MSPNMSVKSHWIKKFANTGSTIMLSMLKKLVDARNSLNEKIDQLEDKVESGDENSKEKLNLKTAVIREEIVNLSRQASTFYIPQNPKEKANVKKWDEYETPIGRALDTVEPLTIYFENDQSDLTFVDKDEVESFAESFLASNPKRVLIAGYSDTAASAESSLEISEKRAVAVMEALMAAKVPRSLFWPQRRMARTTLQL